VAERRDFEDEIQRNRRWTWVLLAASFLLLAVVGTTASYAIGGGWVGALFGVAIALGLTFLSYFQADSLALGSTGARPASVEQFGQLHNLVDAMAISAGIPKPRVYVVEDPAPNAFATGRDPEHAAVAVTTGLLERMSRDELEGVIAHELAHIRNLDIRVMTVAVATAGSVAVITDLFWRLAFWGAIAGGGRRRSGRGGSNPLALVAMIVVAVLAPVAAAMLKAAISRKRESLADATAIKLTRYPTGLRRALEKLDADSTVVRRTSHATSHLWIESPDDREPGKPGARINSMFTTHPPLSERIDILRSMEGLPPYQGPEADVLADIARRTEDARRTDDARATGTAGRDDTARHPADPIAAVNPAAASMPHLAELFGPTAGSAPATDRPTSDLPPPPPPPVDR
jgi:heat shock protein HtpX